MSIVPGAGGGERNLALNLGDFQTALVGSPGGRVTCLGSGCSQTEDAAQEGLLRGEGTPRGTQRLRARPSLGHRSAVWTALAFLSHQLPLAWPCAGNHNRGIHRDFPLNQGLERSGMFQASLPDPSDPKACSKGKRVQAITSSVSAGRRSQGEGRRAGTTQQVPPSKPLASGGPSSLRRDGAGINSFSDSLYFSFLNCKGFF